LKVCARWANHLSEQRLELAFYRQQAAKRLGAGKEVAENGAKQQARRKMGLRTGTQKRNEWMPVLADLVFSSSS